MKPLPAHGVFCEAGHYPCNPQGIEEKTGHPFEVTGPRLAT